MKRSILFIVPSLTQGGIEHSLITLFNNIDFEKYDFTLLTYLDDLKLLPLVPAGIKHIKASLDGHFYRSFKAIMLKILAYFFPKKFSETLKEYIHNQRVLLLRGKYLKNQSFDVVVSYATGICTESAITIPAGKHYVFYHNSLDMHHKMHSKYFPEYDGIVAVSDGVKQMLCENYPFVSNKVIVIKNFVDSNEIIKKSKEFSHEFFRESNLIITSCGRLSKEKGFDLAVESAEILKNKGIDFLWYFIGDGAEREKLEKMISEKNLSKNIVITGFQDNPFPYVGCCDIYVQPSYEEGQPLAVLEAQILGKAIVSTETVGGKTILENGRKGILVPISGQGIADGIIRLISDPELKKSFENLYDIKENEKDRIIYKNAVEALLDS